MSLGDNPIAKDIFTYEDYEELQNAKRALANLIPIVDGLEQCGPECQPFRQSIVHMRERMEKFEALFFNPPPTRG